MTEPRVTVYGAYWCPDCRRAKKFLGEQFVPYKWVDIEQDKDGEMYVLQKNEGKRIIPTIVFEDNTFLVEPSNADLAKKLGLKTEAKKVYYDLIIIDMVPPALDATDFYYQLQALRPELTQRLLFISSGIVNDYMRALLEQTDGYLIRKPFSVADIEAGIRHAWEIGKETNELSGHNDLDA